MLSNIVLELMPGMGFSRAGVQVYKHHFRRLPKGLGKFVGKKSRVRL